MKQLTFSILASCLLLVTQPAAAKSETHNHHRYRHTHHSMHHHHHAHHSIHHQLHLCLFHWPPAHKVTGTYRHHRRETKKAVKSIGRRLDVRHQ